MDIQEIGFGDFCTIEQKRYVGPNEFYSYKVVGRKKTTYGLMFQLMQTIEKKLGMII